MGLQQVRDALNLARLRPIFQLRDMGRKRTYADRVNRPRTSRPYAYVIGAYVQPDRLGTQRTSVYLIQ